MAVDTPSREVLASGLSVTSVGRAHGDASYQLDARVTPEHVLILTLSGRGWYRVGTSVDHVAAGTMLLLPPDLDHGYGAAPGGRWEILWAHLTGPTAAALQSVWAVQSDGRHVLPCALAEPARLLTSALTELSARDDGYGLAAAGFADQALRFALVDARRRHHDGARRADARVISVQAHIDRRLSEPLTLAGLADEVGLSDAYLCRVFKRTTGYSPIEYIVKQRISQAKDLLLTTNRTIASIGREVGYVDPGYFARLFRRTAGVSPSAFREGHIRDRPVPEPD